MGTRKRGWRRVINGVNISAFLVILFVGLPLYWLIISSFKTPADARGQPAEVLAEPVERRQLFPGLQAVRLRHLLP